MSQAAADPWKLYPSSGWAARVAAEAARWVLWDHSHLTSALEIYHLAAVRFIKCLVSRFLKLGYMERSLFLFFTLPTPTLVQ